MGRSPRMPSWTWSPMADNRWWPLLLVTGGNHPTLGTPLTILAPAKKCHSAAGVVHQCLSRRHFIPKPLKPLLCGRFTHLAQVIAKKTSSLGHKSHSQKTNSSVLAFEKNVNKKMYKTNLDDCFWYPIMLGLGKLFDMTPLHPSRHAIIPSFGRSLGSMGWSLCETQK